ncbi:MAG: hypothetical protein P1U56_25460, partial [Saprospiraceae bacterium]|nr:hypothetical protein [Saprospiraceae bacterium]
MKLLNILIAIVFTYTTNAQSLPDLNAVFSIQPKWSYLHEDVNWYPFQSDSNLHWDEFNGSFYSDHMIKDNYYYLLESALGQ